ncbi:MAG: alkaline phosphatase family protein [Candidatus Glassbacteria bacterium]
MNSRKKVLIVGMDGASPGLLFPWAQEGKLPNIARLIENGKHGTLLSTIPPATFPAWSSFMTGTNPGKHGLYDFTTRVKGSYAVEFVNSTYRKTPTIWKLLNEAGYRVGVMGMPSTYPPEHLDGFMISGFDSPVATGIEGSFVWPGDLYGKIKREIGKYLITDFQELRIGPGWHDRALEGLQKTIERKEQIARFLLQNEDVDVFCVLFGESDTVSHHFWSAFDRQSPRFSEPLASRHAGSILKVYRWIDSAIGSILQEFPEDSLILVASDHGFGGSGNEVLYLNRWLSQMGYLSFRDGGSTLINGLEGLKSKLLGVVPVRFQEQLFRRFGGKIANTLESRLRFGSIDWDGTVAFSEELNYFPSIWMNVNGREPEGKVSPGDEYEHLRDDIIRDLENWMNPVSGSPIVKKAWRREELYQGDYVTDAPDIILELALNRGYSYNVLPTRSTQGTACFRTLATEELIGSKGKGMNGSHRREGIYIVSGPSLRGQEEGQTFSIWDPAVTVLEFMGVEITDEMDGVDMSKSLREDAASKASAQKWTRSVSQEPLSQSEQEEIAKRLRSLGYLE